MIGKAVRFQGLLKPTDGSGGICQEGRGGDPIAMLPTEAEAVIVVTQFEIGGRAREGWDCQSRITLPRQAISDAAHPAVDAEDLRQHQNCTAQWCADRSGPPRPQGRRRHTGSGDRDRDPLRTHALGIGQRWDGGSGHERDL